MVEKGPPAPTPRPVRAKPATQTKTKKPPQKIPPKLNTSKATTPKEPRVVLVPLVPADHPEDQVSLYPPNQPNQLHDIPLDQLNQPPNNPPNPQPNLPDQPPNLPANPPNPMQPQNPPPQVPPQGKPEEDTVVHLLRPNDWMETHNFPDGAKVQRFCLTLTGEARLWYETLRPIEIDWTALQVW